MTPEEAAAFVKKWGNKPLSVIMRHDERYPNHRVLDRLFEAMAITGDLVKNEDGTYSLPEDHEA